DPGAAARAPCRARRPRDVGRVAGVGDGADALRGAVDRHGQSSPRDRWGHERRPTTIGESRRGCAMSAKRTPWWRRRLSRAGRERGMVEAGVAAAGGLLVVGAVVGNGVAASVMDMSDGQTWLP